VIRRYHSVWDVSKQVWKELERLVPARRKAGTVGRPPLANERAFEGIVHVLRTGCQWKSLPTAWFGAASSIHQRFQRWVSSGIWAKLYKRMLQVYDRLRKIQWKWQSLDSKSVPAPLGGEKTGKNPTDRGKLGSKWHYLVDQRGAPLSIVISAANVHDKRCAMAVIQACPLRKPRRRYRVHHFCADKAYDAADLRKAVARRRYQVHIARRGLEPVFHKKHPARRYVVERTNSWTAQFRGLRVRWAKKADNWLAFLHLAAAITLCRMSIYG